MKRMPVWMALVLGAVVLCGTAHGAETCCAASVPQDCDGMPLLFQDDFENGRDHWEATDDEAWKIEALDEGNHVFWQYRGSKYEPPVRSPHNMARVKDLKVTDFVLKVLMKQTGKEYGHRDMCIFFGYQDPSHFYYVHIATKADAHANSVFLVNDAPRVSIAKERTDGTDWGKDWHEVCLKRDTASGSIEVYFDDMETPIMKASDTTFSWGTIGFGTFDDTGQVDDVRLWGKTKE